MIIHPVQKEFYVLFKLCSGFNSITIFENMQECHEFLERQLQYGTLESLQLRSLLNFERWPERLIPLLKRFVQSPNFRLLDLYIVNLHIDFELASLFMDRWRSNNLREGSTLRGLICFPESHELQAICANLNPVQKKHDNGYKLYLEEGLIDVLCGTPRYVEMKYNAPLRETS